MIRQFDVFRNPLRGERAAKPFVVCVQHRRLDHLNTRVVAPLAAGAPVHEESRLYPTIVLQSATLHFDPTELIALPARLLDNPVANLEPQRDKIIAALDLVFTGI
jgi:toxin CcdB